MDGDPNPNELTPQQKDAILANVRAEVQAQALQELTKTMTQKCYEKCVSRPGEKLDNKSLNCLKMCTDRYIEAMQIVSAGLMKKGSQ